MHMPNMGKVLCVGSHTTGAKHATGFKNGKTFD